MTDLPPPSHEESFPAENSGSAKPAPVATTFPRPRSREVQDGAVFPPRRAGYLVPTVAPRLTYFFLGLTVLVFLAQLAGEVVFGYDVAAVLGYKDNARIVAGQYWRLVTPIFLHAGLLHIVFNMYALYALGPQIEAPYGYLRFGLIYVLSGITGVVLSMALNPFRSVGASGAIFGLIGALGAYLYRHRKAFGGYGQRRLTNVVTIAAINLLIGLSPGIDNWGHLGGLLGGTTLAVLIGPRLELETDYSTGQIAVVDQTPLASRGIGLAAFCLGLLVLTGAVIVYRAGR